MTFTQEQRDFLNWEYLNSRQIFVNFDTNLFYIADEEYLYELTTYFRFKFGRRISTPHSTINDMTLSYPDRFFSLDDLDGLNSVFNREDLRISTVACLKKKKAEIIIQELVRVLTYGYHNGEVVKFEINEDYKINATEYGVSKSEWLEIFILDSHGDHITDFDGEDDIARLLYDDFHVELFRSFELTEQQLGDFLNNTISDKEVLAQIEQITTLLGMYYPDKYDIDIPNKIVILHWDKVEISNSQGATHTMYDFYIRLKFNNQFNRLSELSGLRATFTLKEYWNNNPYTFSHLGTSRFGEWGNLCLGSTPLADMYTILKTPEFSLLVLEAFLLQLNEYVRWESLEGGPYRGSNIGKIAYKSNTNTIPTFNTYRISKYDVQKIISKIYLVLEIKTVSNNLGTQLELIDTPLLERAVHATCVKYGYLNGMLDTSKPFEVYKNFETNETFWEQELKTTNTGDLTKVYFEQKKLVEQGNSDLFSFKGTQVRRKLLPEHFEDEVIQTEETKTMLPKVLAPALYLRIKTLINEQLLILTKKKIDEHYINNRIKEREIVTS